MLLALIKIRSGTTVALPLGCSQYKAIRVRELNFFAACLAEYDKKEDKKKR